MNIVLAVDLYWPLFSVAPALFAQSSSPLLIDPNAFDCMNASGVGAMVLPAAATYDTAWSPAVI